MDSIAFVEPEHLRLAVTLMVGLLQMLGATRINFTFFPRARLELESSPGVRFRRWDAGMVARLFRSPEDPKLVGLDCAMFALMMAMTRLKGSLREGDVGMWFPLWLPNTCGSSKGPPKRVRSAWRAGRIRPFSTENPDCWWPGPDVYCFGYDPAIAYHPVTKKTIYESQWVCRVADDLYAGLKKDGVYFLSRDEWSALVAASNDGKEPEFLTYTDE